MTQQAPARAAALVCLLILHLTVLPVTRKADAANAAALPQSFGTRSVRSGPYALGTFVQRMVDGRIVCFEADTEQVHRLKDRDPNLPLSGLALDRSEEHT